tara:strand:+ start:2158 stop:2337 length:180 start_codon:yes stop_codon:yes gene_type:complete
MIQAIDEELLFFKVKYTYSVLVGDDAICKVLLLVDVALYTSSQIFSGCKFRYRRNKFLY